MNNPKVAIITPTTGAKYLNQNIKSVESQTYTNLTHIVVVDGSQYFDKVDASHYPSTKFIRLDQNTGAGGYNGHRIYGGIPYLIDADYFIFLDEDNWIDKDHVETLVEKSKYYDWSFSLRKIVDKDSNYVCNDDCESLGLWPSVLSSTEYFVDVGCYFLPKKFVIETAPIWYRRARHPQEQPEVDRLLIQVLLQKKFTYHTNGLYTLNYRVGNRVDSVQADFFLRGNSVMEQKYNGDFPWRKAADTITLTF